MAGSKKPEVAIENTLETHWMHSANTISKHRALSGFWVEICVEGDLCLWSHFFTGVAVSQAEEQLQGPHRCNCFCFCESLKCFLQWELRLISTSHITNLWNKHWKGTRQFYNSSSFHSCAFFSKSVKSACVHTSKGALECMSLSRHLGQETCDKFLRTAKICLRATAPKRIHAEQVGLEGFPSPMEFQSHSSPFGKLP